MTEDVRVIVCNYAEGTKVVAAGSKAYVAHAYLGGNLPDRVLVIARSRGGRWVEKWESLRRLGNFRLTTLPPEHPRRAHHWLQYSATEEHLDRLTRLDPSWKVET